MCGILGGTLRGAGRERTGRALDLIAHRGPDDEGWYDDPEFGVWLGARRLSILDIEAGAQPMANEDGSLQLVFNGEIYNAPELRERLCRQGHTFASQADTEVIVHLYEEYGAACVHLLRGMFAFALWDRHRRRLFLARDRLGIKPLYYALAGGGLLFASEIKALLDLPGVTRGVDQESLDLYLALQYVPGPRTLFEGIAKLPPGHTLTLHVDEPAAPSIEQYWAPVLDEGQARMHPRDAATEFGMLLDDAVRTHLLADVPVGALLSGGIDSATVVGLMARHLPGRVKTFTVGFDEPEYSEFEHARAVSRRFDTDHHELLIGAEHADYLPRLIWHMDEPIADRAALPLYLISRFARDQVKVVLTGEGGDELLGGYPRYSWFTLATRLQRNLPAPLRGAASAFAGLIPAAHLRRQAQLLVGTLSPAERHLRWVGTFSADERRRLYRHPHLRALLARQLPETLVGTFLNSSDSAADGAGVQELMALDFRTWLVDDILMKVDKMSMAASLEARVPILDHRLVEFTTALPLSVKIQSFGTKRLLREMASGFLPRSIVRRRKQAFDVPAAKWMRGSMRPLLEENLLSDRHARRGLFESDAVHRLVQEHVEGRADHNQKLWSLLCLELWYRVYIDRELTFSPIPAASHVGEVVGSPQVRVS